MNRHSYGTHRRPAPVSVWSQSPPKELLMQTQDVRATVADLTLQSDATKQVSVSSILTRSVTASQELEELKKLMSAEKEKRSTQLLSKQLALQLAEERISRNEDMTGAQLAAAQRKILELMVKMVCELRVVRGCCDRVNSQSRRQ